MSTLDLQSLIWLFPVAFLLHDLEELIFWEKWMKKNKNALEEKLPLFLKKTARRIFEKPARQVLVTMLLIFGMVVLSSCLALVFHYYWLFIFACSVFFVHGFMHIGQAIILRRYVPAVITSVIVVIPYGLIVFNKLIDNGIVGPATLLITCIAGILFTVPFLLLMHKITGR
jgi:hypothetical protein